MIQISYGTQISQNEDSPLVIPDSPGLEFPAEMETQPIQYLQPDTAYAMDSDSDCSDDYDVSINVCYRALKNLLPFPRAKARSKICT